MSHPYGGISLPLDRIAILEKAHIALDTLQISDENLWPDVSLAVNRSLLRQTQKMKGIAESNALVRDSIPVYKWKVQWRKDKGMKFSFGNDDAEEKQQSEKIENILRGDITFFFDTKGRLIEFSRVIPDTIPLTSLSSSEAKILAMEFLAKHPSTIFSIDTSKFVSEQTTQQLHRVDYEFTWLSPDSLLNDPIKIKVKVAGNIITSYEPVITVPEMYKRWSSESISGIIILILIIVGSVLLIVFAIKRIRSFEIGFQQALIMGILVALAFGIRLFVSYQGSNNAWEILIPMLLVPTFTGGILVLLWAISESITREVWGEKMIPFDLMFKGHILHPKIGWSFVRGISFGFILFAVLLILSWIGNTLTPVSISIKDDSSLHTFDSGSSWLLIFSDALFYATYTFAFSLLFFVSFLRRNISSRSLIFIISTVIIALLNVGRMEPIFAALGIQSVIAFITVWIFYKYDGLAALICLTVYSLLPEATGLFFAGNPVYTSAGMIILIAGSLVFLTSLILCFRKNAIQDFSEIAPAFAKHISERQRLQQELEIARNVQMSFLPKCDPEIPQFDICSRCAPALEVGGDYYDYIELEGGKKFAVAVGDVSGKGTQAAFFMTLTKGFLRALAHISESPAKVLTRVNHLFYENVDRGIFISMIYGVFDLKKRTLTVARAGHNHVIMRKSKAGTVKLVNPSGLALGLDAGKKFVQSIEEVNVRYQPGDLFIFYTDGFTEAMNTEKEEFGEKRLTNAIERLANLSATEIVDGIFNEMHSFVGKNQQHDDMSIVVVKIKRSK